MRIAWEVYVIVVMLLIAAGVVLFMLVYRSKHKTNIETNLLLKQMRITSRMRGVLDAQREYISKLDHYHGLAYEDWEHIRSFIKTKADIDIGDRRPVPEPPVDFTRLIAHLDRG